MTEDLKTKKALIWRRPGDQGTAMDAGGDRSVAPAARGRAWRGRQNGNGIHCGRAERCGTKGNINQQEEAEEQYEEEFDDLLHFKTLEDAEVSIMRLDELMRKFRSQGEPRAVERVLNIARLGKRRAEMNLAQQQWSS